MNTLINILSGVALLVWGTHIVRSGVLRVFGTNLQIGFMPFLPASVLRAWCNLRRPPP